MKTSCNLATRSSCGPTTGLRSPDVEALRLDRKLQASARDGIEKSRRGSPAPGPKAPGVDSLHAFRAETALGAEAALLRR